jgi:hypothetical protein
VSIQDSDGEPSLSPSTSLSASAIALRKATRHAAGTPSLPSVLPFWKALDAAGLGSSAVAREQRAADRERIAAGETTEEDREGEEEEEEERSPPPRSKAAAAAAPKPQSTRAHLFPSCAVAAAAAPAASAATRSGSSPLRSLSLSFSPPPLLLLAAARRSQSLAGTPAAPAASLPASEAHRRARQRRSASRSRLLPLRSSGLLSNRVRALETEETAPAAFAILRALELALSPSAPPLSIGVPASSLSLFVAFSPSSAAERSLAALAAPATSGEGDDRSACARAREAMEAGCLGASLGFRFRGGGEGGSNDEGRRKEKASTVALSSLQHPPLFPSLYLSILT